MDGTRGFLEGRKEWCISLAVIENNRPVEAVLHCPPLERTFYAKLGQGVKFSALVEPKKRTPGKPLATGSKKLIETMAQLPGQPFDVAPFIPSLAYRLAMVATGELDAAFAKPGASEWDVAAADLILREAKCQLTTNDGDAIRYNQRSVTLPSLLAASNNNHDTIMSLANSSRIIH
ncbi:MAG: inositol monophosphatase family protein [Pseudomonadota bacterium]